MVLSCALTQFEIGPCQASLTRDLYLDAFEKVGAARRYILKKNKWAKAHLTQMEIALTAVAGVFLQKNLSPLMMRVMDDSNQIWGAACEHMSQNAAIKEGLPGQFWSIPNDGRRLGPMQCFIAERADEIPVYFLKDFGPQFFANLYHAAQLGHLSFDWDSLASVMASSYTLEEDDLHKGNLGFYLSDKNGLPHVVFFKIDNDLMMADSLMSREMTRFWNFFNNDTAFAITARDLRDFPKLHDSQNYYWPTRQRFFVNITASQHYGSVFERDAFAALASEPEFIKAKWRVFYKHILLSDKLINAALSNHLDRDDASERAKLNLVLQAVVARQARLRAVLFSMPEFRCFVSELSADDKQAILSDMPEGACHDEVNAMILQHQAMCTSDHPLGFCEGDTPIHAAIRLGDYRYIESIDAFKSHFNTPNALGYTALDVAMQRAILNGPEDDFRKDAYSIAKHLLAHGAKALAEDRFAIKPQLDDYQKPCSYLERARLVRQYDDLKCLLRDIGEDSCLALKTRKDMALCCVQAYIHTNQRAAQFEAILKLLKVDLNGNSLQKPAPELDYIRQLRSQWWIVRYLRGLFGGTASQFQMNGDIERALSNLKPKSYGFWDFFKPAAEVETLVHPPVLH